MTRSEELFARAQQHIPGGVNSPVRAFRGVGGTPRFIASAEGVTITDADGNSYIDYVGSWGPMILGHNHPAVLQAVREAAGRGLSFGAPTEAEIDMAELVCALVPSMDMVRMCSSGTEATMSAIRLARGYTGRNKLIKFEGGYHGHGDALLVKAGSGLLTLSGGKGGVPSSAGVPASYAEHTLTATFNDLAGVEALFQAHAGDVAALIVEPIAGNMNCIPPVPGFLEGLRALCDAHGAVLIFDEVMTGFRVALGGAQALYGITPDLTTLGKIIGGGMPVGAFGGRRAIMECLAPLGPVYQAGTLSGNPVAMAAGITALSLLATPGFHARLAEQTDRLTAGLQARAEAAGVPLLTQHVCGMFGLFFTERDAVRNYAEVAACDSGRFNRFFHAMLDQGVYLAPSAFEAGFVSAAHDDAAIARTLEAAERAFTALAR